MFFRLLIIPIFLFLIGCEDKPSINAKNPNIFTDKTDFLKYLNSARKDVGLNELKEDMLLTKIANYHAQYIVANNSTGHEENPEKKSFYEKTPAKRAKKIGMPSTFVLENITYKKDPNLVIDSLLSAIYHRFGFLNTQINAIGFKKLDTKEISSTVFNMSNTNIQDLCRKKSTNNIIDGFYIKNICTNQTIKIPKKDFDNAINLNKKGIFVYPKNIPAQPYFSGENPDPMPKCKILSTPVSVEFSKEYKNIKIKNFEIYKDNKKIKNTVILNAKNDPNKLLNNNQFVLFGLTPFEFATNYTAKIEFTAGNKQMSYSWDFNTSTPQNPYFVVHNNERLSIKPNKDYDIFFMPKNCNDLLKNYSYNTYLIKKINIDYADANMLRINMQGIKGASATIKAGDREITLILNESSSDIKQKPIVIILLIAIALISFYFAGKSRKKT